jgi:hypothetical protein
VDDLALDHVRNAVRAPGGARGPRPSGSGRFAGSASLKLPRPPGAQRPRGPVGSPAGRSRGAAEERSLQEAGRPDEARHERVRGPGVDGPGIADLLERVAGTPAARTPAPACRGARPSSTRALATCPRLTPNQRSGRETIVGNGSTPRRPTGWIPTDGYRWSPIVSPRNPSVNPEVAGSIPVEPAISTAYGPARIWMKIQAAFAPCPLVFPPLGGHSRPAASRIVTELSLRSAGDPHHHAEKDRGRPTAEAITADLLDQLPTRARQEKKWT